jgi:hypothetical protein
VIPHQQQQRFDSVKTVLQIRVHPRPLAESSRCLRPAEK